MTFYSQNSHQHVPAILKSDAPIPMWLAIFLYNKTNRCTTFPNFLAKINLGK